ncbi:MAG: radical SAM protein [Deltaproteobacteria bacterium]|nr:radical SAM protein [Deltaproteobacteria bacterium]
MKLLLAGENDTLYAHPFLRAAGMAGEEPVALRSGAPVAYGTRLMSMPGWDAVGFDPGSGSFETVQEIKLGRRWRRVFAVAAVPPPGYLRLLLPGAKRTPAAPLLPLWAYTAAGAAARGEIMATLRVDRRRRWDTACYDTPALAPAIEAWKKRYPKNRIVAQLARCATEYFCSTARNLFLGRYEAALPLARACNSRCVGCISKRHGGHPCSQERIGFSPSADEAVDVAARHLSRARDPVVSFGQGCEGEPLTAATLVEEIVRRTRAETPQGVFNMNTNGSLPSAFERLVKAGLGSVRVSLSSAVAGNYDAYFRPRGYSLSDVKRTIRLSARRGVFTSINLLVFPGVTDTKGETEAFVDLVEETGANFIQLRNLSIDPSLYPVRGMKLDGAAFGMSEWLRLVKEALPRVGFGCYNPTPSEIRRWT